MKLKILYFVIINCMFLIACEPSLNNTSVEAAPTIKLFKITPDFAKNNATIEGEIVANTNEIGLVYNTSPLPTIDNEKIVLQKGDNGKTITTAIGNLKTNQRYYVRLYAKIADKIVYSNEKNIMLSPYWTRMKDIPYEGQPLAYGWMFNYFGVHQISIFTRSTLISESKVHHWTYFVGGSDREKWQDNEVSEIAIEPLRYSPIYLPYREQTTYFFGGGYSFSPEPRPIYSYQKSFDDYRDGVAIDYPGADVPTIQFAIGDNLPDLYVLEVGNQYRLWKYQNSEAPTTWAAVEKANFPKKNLQKLYAFAMNGKGYVLSEDDNSLWQFDPITQSWKQQRNIPFANRERGAIITTNKGALYGLGYNIKTGEGYRDLWLYNDQNDSWSYFTDYPGEGSANVTVVGRGNLVGFLMGYRAIATPIGTTEFTAAHDAWVFEPK